MSHSFDAITAVSQFLGLFVGLTMHQAAKAMTARALGDRSPATQQRATVNPLPHIDIMGTLVFPLLFISMGASLLFGWAKPLVLDTRYFKKLKRNINLIHAGGLLFFILLILFCSLVLKFLPPFFQDFNDPLYPIVIAILQVNIILFVFHLLPLPGSDMWSMILNSVNYNLARRLKESEQMISLGVLVLFLLESQNVIFLFRPLIHTMVNSIESLLSYL